MVKRSQARPSKAGVRETRTPVPPVPKNAAFLPAEECRGTATESVGAECGAREQLMVLAARHIYGRRMEKKYEGRAKQ